MCERTPVLSASVLALGPTGTLSTSVPGEAGGHPPTHPAQISAVQYGCRTNGPRRACIRAAACSAPSPLSRGPQTTPPSQVCVLIKSCPCDRRACLMDAMGIFFGFFSLENVGPDQVRRCWQVRFGLAQQGHPGELRQGRGQHPDRQRRRTWRCRPRARAPGPLVEEVALPPHHARCAGTSCTCWGPRAPQKFTVSGSRASESGNTSAELKAKYFDAANGTGRAFVGGYRLPSCRFPAHARFSGPVGSAGSRCR